MGLNECGCNGGTENTCQGSLAVVCMEMGVQNSLRESGEKLGKPTNPYSVLPFKKHTRHVWYCKSVDPCKP